jgi:septin family protein
MTAGTVYNRLNSCKEAKLVFKKAILWSAAVPGFILAHLCTVSALSSTAPQIGQPRIEKSQQERDMEDRRQKELNKKRQDEIRDDTQKLFQLATELKSAVDKSNEHVLSLDVIKKAEEVEKLAKKIKDKMKEGAGKPAIGEPEPIPVPSPFPH